MAYSPGTIDLCEEEVSGNNTGRSVVTHHDRLDPNLVQITASNDEIKRRIAAFCEHKRNEINENNRREYCNAFSYNPYSCVRTDAVFVPRVGCKGHVKVSRVSNPYGPQTAQFSPSKNETKTDSRAQTQNIVEERLKNIESHLDSTDESSQSDVHTRLKTLEEKILYLESLSPEYFKIMPQTKRRESHKSSSTVVKETFRMNNDQVQDDDDLSLVDIDEQMCVLRHKLHSRLL